VSIPKILPRVNKTDPAGTELSLRVVTMMPFTPVSGSSVQEGVGG
jgi:hypothetical protein